MKEIDGRIPNSLDRQFFLRAHFLGMRKELWLTMGGDLSALSVLDMRVRSFLIGNSLVQEGER